MKTAHYQEHRIEFPIRTAVIGKDDAAVLIGNDVLWNRYCFFNFLISSLIRFS